MDALQNTHDFTALAVHAAEPFARAGTPAALVHGIVHHAVDFCLSLVCDVATPIVAIVIRIGDLPLLAHGSNVIAF